MAGSVNPDPYQLARFFSNVTFGECWTWGGIMNSNGYGRFTLSKRRHLADCTPASST